MKAEIERIKAALDAAGSELWQTYGMTPRVQPLFDQIAAALALLSALIAEAPQVQKEQGDTRVDDSQYQQPFATASENKLGPTRTKDCGCVMEKVVSEWWAHRHMCAGCHEHRNER